MKKNYIKLLCIPVAILLLFSLRISQPKLTTSAIFDELSYEYSSDLLPENAQIENSTSENSISEHEIDSENKFENNISFNNESDDTNVDTDEEIITNNNDKNYFENSSSQQTIPVAKIVVYGGGKVSIKPDIAYVTIGVESKDSKLQTAINDNNDAVSAIIEHLKSKNIDENNIKTKYYSVYQSHDYSTSERFQEYHVVNTIEYKTTDLENLGETISKLTQLGANRVEDIQFDCSDISNCYNEALKLALEDAKSKAKTFTDKPLTIEKIAEECVYTCMPYRGIESLSQNADIISSGNIDIEAKITVVFI